MQDSWNVPATPGLNSFSEDDCSMPAVDEWRPRPRRPLAHPQRCDGSTVALFAYAAAPPRSSTPAGARAASLRQDDDGRARFSGRLRYYLPEGWCSSYKFTVFERSYVVQLDSHGSEQFCLARPVTASLADAARDFELVWPVPLEPSILDAVAHACDARQATKRKPESAAAAELGALSSMHTKLRRLSVASHGPQPPQLHPQPPQPQHHVARGMWHVPGNALQ
ncbi:hypothetical protein EMIHUDRAFT_443582 [Emiliania huxleyi CCMP1516]|uniref:Uncharacterized protein n=2 Tax=Emiliania huxleyi TaxID=2903 RepID=A0A0D3JQ15_EMIH1|nr:hypothetical protein EMIHUDRAFT_443582 [Emiliania huxleyi CCMP1516]EOD25600.1 hypothetical protein EMIHUDRAFT_443582 [Emiliania huxleyi CCMP1516]|eukprot:XP_005778029.1 hypothetical protein EMIHUDRAFT_443582 [Emiliania huxleyi CCMP1516]